MMKSILGLAALMLVAAHSPPAQAQAEPVELSATEAAALIREGKLKSEDLVRALADAMEKKRDLNSFVSFDREAALNAAREADAAAARKRFKGPLHGVPLVVKDNIHVRGFANTAGTPALKDFRPRRNAPVVRKLLDAGAIVLGKTNMHELAFGITSNNAEFGPAHYGLGVVGQLDGNTDVATREYAEALRIDPSFADAGYNLGVVLEDQGNLGAAIALSLI